MEDKIIYSILSSLSLSVSGFTEVSSYNSCVLMNIWKGMTSSKSRGTVSEMMLFHTSFWQMQIMRTIGKSNTPKKRGIKPQIGINPKALSDMLRMRRVRVREKFFDFQRDFFSKGGGIVIIDYLYYHASCECQFISRWEMDDYKPYARYVIRAYCAISGISFKCFFKRET